MQRHLDGVYFRIEQENGKFANVCFSDLTEEQMNEVLQGKDEKWLKNLCVILPTDQPGIPLKPKPPIIQ